MNTINLELSISEAIKLLSSCNAAILSIERLPETIQHRMSKELEEIVGIKDKIKSAIMDSYGV